MLARERRDFGGFLKKTRFPFALRAIKVPETRDAENEQSLVLSPSASSAWQVCSFGTDFHFALKFRDCSMRQIQPNAYFNVKYFQPEFSTMAARCVSGKGK